MEEDGLFPERCPICHRLNARNGDDYCEHYWGTTYDHELIDGPYAEEFEALWSMVENTYQTTNDVQADGFLRLLREAGLDEIASAVVDTDKFWWMSEVTDKVFIDAEASPASGTGWSLYHREPKWFEGVLDRMRKAAELGQKAKALQT
jgi:hypothetical protein